jgi:hypothetical protein
MTAIRHHAPRAATPLWMNHFPTRRPPCELRPSTTAPRTRVTFGPSREPLPSRAAETETHRCITRSSRAGGRARGVVMLSVKKILAGRGATNYYLEQTRRGLADYYLPEQSSGSPASESGRLSAPGASWWGSGADVLGLEGPVERGQFVPLYAKGVRPDGGYLGRRFRTQEDAAETACRAARRDRDDHRSLRALARPPTARPLRAAGVGGGVGLHLLAGEVGLAVVGCRGPSHPAAGLGRPPRRGRRRARLPRGTRRLRAGRPQRHPGAGHRRAGRRPDERVDLA